MNPLRLAELHINKRDETVGIYGFAYLDAAAKVFKHGICDFAPYPGMLCLRHGVELVAKQLSVYMAYELRDKKFLYRPGHNLKKAWKKVFRELSALSHIEVADDEFREALATFDRILREVDGYDPSGQLFRYPEELLRDENMATVVRKDTHVPWDKFDLDHWAQVAGNALGAAQTLEGHLGERCGWLMSHRKHYSTSLYDLVASPDFWELQPNK